MEWYKASILAQLWDESAQQSIDAENKGFDMFANTSSNSQGSMTEEEKQAYVDWLTNAEYAQMNTYKFQWYDFETAKALLENSRKLSSSNSQNEAKWWFIRNVIWAAWDSATWIWQFLWNSAADIIWWTAKKLWADEERVDYLVNDFKNYLEDSKISNTVGANTDSLTYKWTKMVWDLAQTYALWALWGEVLWWTKLGQWINAVKNSWLIWKTAVGAAEWAADMWLYSIIDDAELPSKWELIAWWVLWAASPMLGALWKWISKMTRGKAVKFAEDIVGWLNKLSTWEKNDFFKRFGESANKWMNDRWIKSWEDLIRYFETSKGLVDTQLEKIEWRYTSQILTDILEWVKKNGKDGVWLKWIAQHAVDTHSPEAARMIELLNKNRNWWLTMSEINEAKRYFEKHFKMTYNPKFGNVQWNAEKHTLATNLDSELRNWQYWIAEKMWFWDLAKLNKETQAAYFLKERVKIPDAMWNSITLSDWMYIAQAVRDWKLWAFIGKKTLEAPRFQKLSVDVLNKLWWHKNVDNMVMDALELSKVKNEKWLKKWLEMRWDDIGDLWQDVTIAWMEEIND